jgi:hypothetical protein
MLKTLVLACSLAFAATLSAQQPCESLMKLALPHATVTSAAVVAATAEIPSHCDVKASARPTSDSEINFEVWLPSSDWNGKYQQVGNGGWAGNIPLVSFAEPLKRGFAVAGTDDGHAAGPDAAWAIGHPEKLIDFGYRAVHETALQSRAIVQAFYGKAPTRSYFVGCSDGGREALMEAQRFADDFDGIVAGAPAYNWSHLFAGFLWNERALLDDPKATIPAAKLPTIQKAVLGQCDALDGVKDGVIEDPRACHFDSKALLCKGADGDECLTAPQAAALAKIYAGPRNPRTGAQIVEGFPPGVEAEQGTWSYWIIPNANRTPAQFIFANTFFGQAVYEDPKWDFRTANFDEDVRYGDEKAGVVLNSNNPDLRSFRARGGKLIQYHGWGDAAIPATSSIAYYEKVKDFMNKFPDGRSGTASSLDNFYLLFMVPGMGHCAGGNGPNTFGNRPGAPIDPDHDVVAALEQWVEKGIAPKQLIGSGKASGDSSATLTRPLCAYPQTAHYNGTGDTNQAVNFTCK